MQRSCRVASRRTNRTLLRHLLFVTGYTALRAGLLRCRRHAEGMIVKRRLSSSLAPAASSCHVADACCRRAFSSIENASAILSARDGNVEMAAIYSSEPCLFIMCRDGTFSPRVLLALHPVFLNLTSASISISGSERARKVNQDHPSSPSTPSLGTFRATRPPTVPNPTPNDRQRKQPFRLVYLQTDQLTDLSTQYTCHSIA